MPEEYPSNSLIALYLLFIMAAYGATSWSDYAEARKLECANQSTRKWLVTWDAKADRCVKEVRNGVQNGKTTKN